MSCTSNIPTSTFIAFHALAALVQRDLTLKTLFRTNLFKQDTRYHHFRQSEQVWLQVKQVVLHGNNTPAGWVDVSPVMLSSIVRPGHGSLCSLFVDSCLTLASNNLPTSLAAKRTKLVPGSLEESNSASFQGHIGPKGSLLPCAAVSAMAINATQRRQWPVDNSQPLVPGATNIYCIDCESPVIWSLQSTLCLLLLCVSVHACMHASTELKQFQPGTTEPMLNPEICVQVTVSHLHKLIIHTDFGHLWVPWGQVPENCGAPTFTIIHSSHWNLAACEIIHRYCNLPYLHL